MTATYGESITAILKADTALSAVLVGGVYNYPEMGPKGLNRIMQADAYDPQIGLLNPICIVLETDETIDGQAVDGGGLWMSTQTPVSTWIYEAGQKGFGIVQQAYDLIYPLLQAQQIPGAFQILLKRTARNKREPLLKDAALFRADWIVYGFRDLT